MPITIKHGGGLPGLAGILQGQGQYATRESQLRGQDLARIYGEQFQDKRLGIQIAAQKSMATERARTQAGIAAANNAARRSMQAASLQTQRANSKRQIQAQAQRQSQAADQAYKRMAVQSGLQGELQEQAFDREVKMLEERARQKVSERKQIYTEEGKRQINEANVAKDWLEGPGRELLDPRSWQEAYAKADAQERGVRSRSVPDTDPKPPEGFQPYESGTLPNGMGYIVGPDGKLVTQPFEKTKEGFAFVQQQKQQEAAIKKLEDFDKAKTAFIAKTVGTKYVVPTPSDPGYKITAFGFPISTTIGEKEEGEEDRLHTVASAGALADEIFGQKPQQAVQPTAPQQAPTPEQQVPSPQTRQPGWQNFPGAENLIIYESDLSLPPVVGHAMAYMRTVYRKFGPKKNLWKKETRDAFDKAKNIVEDFQRPGLGLER